MKYHVFVSGAPKSRSRDESANVQDPHSAREERESGGGDGATFAGHGGTPVLRRFPPVIQFLTDVDPYVQQQLQSLCIKSHRQGKNLQELCEELYVYARSIGYVLTLGVQEVFSSQMPSFPRQTVQSALLMADLSRITSPNGYHQGRVAV